MNPALALPLGTATGLSTKPALALPPGVTVLSMSGTDRTELRFGVALAAVGLLSAGFALGWWFCARRTR